MITVSKFDLAGKLLATTAVATIEQARAFLDKLDERGRVKKGKRVTVSIPTLGGNFDEPCSGPRVQITVSDDDARQIQGSAAELVRPNLGEAA